MAKIKFMPIQNPIDKLYTDVTGMPFPVSAAVTGGNADLQFGTLNIGLLDPVYYEISAITMTANQDMTGKEVHVNGGGDSYFTIEMTPSENDPKLLVVVDLYPVTNYTDNMLIHPNDIATTHIQPDDVEGPVANYHVDYNWGTAVIDYLEHGRDGESDPEFRITLDADLSDWAMARIADGEEQGGVLDPGPWPVIYLNADYETIQFNEQEAPATIVDNHFHGVSYASVSDNIQTLCDNWNNLNPTDLYCTNTIDVVDMQQGYPVVQVGVGFRATFGSYVPDCQ